MRVRCASAWGIGFLIVFGGVTLLYVVGGVGFAVKTQGKRVALTSHPQYSQWQEMHGLVKDGIEYARLGGKAGVSRSGTRQAVVASKYGAVEQEEKPHKKKKKKNPNISSDKPHDDQPRSKSM